MNELVNEYEDFVISMASRDSMRNWFSKLLTTGLGCAGEAGEVADIVKKVSFHGMDFSDEVRDKFEKELGDLLWYVTFGTKTILNKSLTDLMQTNIEKLRARYQSGAFSTEEFMAKERSNAN